MLPGVLSVVLLATPPPVPAPSGGLGNAPWYIASAVVTLLVGLGSGYLVSRRVNSGRIDTTDASKLWDESNSMRQELRDEVVSLRGKVSEQSGKIDLLNTQMETLRDKHVECQRNEEALRAKLHEIEARMSRSRKTTPARPRKRT